MIEFICNLTEDEDLENLESGLSEYGIRYKFDEVTQRLRVSEEDSNDVEEILSELFIDYEIAEDCED